VAHREATLVHRIEGCEHGRLRRVAPLMGPSDHPIATVAPPRSHEVPRVRPAEVAPMRERVARRAPHPAPAAPAGHPPPSELGSAMKAMCAVTEGAPRLELARTFVGLLPTLSEKLTLVELVEGEEAGPGQDLGDRVAAEVASATPGALARERRLLDLLRLAQRRGRLAPAELGRRLEDEGVAARLLASALRWTQPAGGPPAPPRLAWRELLQLVDVPVLRDRIRRLAEHIPTSANVWERVAVKLAARELDGALEWCADRHDGDPTARSA
jgi:hypothetical protein